MARGRSMREKFKQQMKSYRKKKMKEKEQDKPYLPPDGEVYVMNSLNPTKKMKAEVLKIKTKKHREIIDELACPKCGNPMKWNNKWDAFICHKHGKKAIYEMVEKD